MSIDWGKEIVFVDYTGNARHQCVYIGDFTSKKNGLRYAIVKLPDFVDIFIVDFYTGDRITNGDELLTRTVPFDQNLKCKVINKPEKKWSIVYTLSNGNVSQTCFIYDSLEDASNHKCEVDGYVIGYVKQDAFNFVPSKNVRNGQSYGICT